jgi:hypothetical protein
MWKIALAFIAFAAVALYFISKGGEHVDMGGEKHGTEAAAPAPAAVTAPAPAASAK